MENVLLTKLEKEYEKAKLNYKLPVILGVNEKGKPTFADLADLKHILISGSTGSGKSMFMHTILYNFMHLFSPKEIKFLLIDMKKVELTSYEGSPYLLNQPTSDFDTAYSAIKWIIAERQYRQQGKTDRDLPIIVFIDTFSDLMNDDDYDFSEFLESAMSRFGEANIHFVLSDSRTSEDVFTKDILKLFPTKICFNVADEKYSELLLGQPGAEKLKGKGDMLVRLPDGKLNHLQAPFISDEEINKLLNFVSSNDS